MEISNDKNHSAGLLAVYTLNFVIITVVFLPWVEEAKITPKVPHLTRGLNFFFFKLHAFLPHPFTEVSVHSRWDCPVKATEETKDVLKPMQLSDNDYHFTRGYTNQPRKWLEEAQLYPSMSQVSIFYSKNAFWGALKFIILPLPLFCLILTTAHGSRQEKLRKRRDLPHAYGQWMMKSGPGLVFHTIFTQHARQEG